MEKRSILMVAILFIVIIVGMFVFAYLKNSEIEETQLSAPTTVNDGSNNPSTPYDSIVRVDAKHFFSDGEHVLVGEMTMPTQCDLLDFDVLVAESFPEQVSVNFKVVNTDPESCPSVPTTQRFKVSVTASEEATFSATFMGRNIELNLIDALPGETPDDFELFLKG